jgi:hypothetical protein
MDYKEFKVPFISDSLIKEKADLFRKKYWGDIIPVNIEIIIEENLSIKIIPEPGLYRQCSTDAYISSDWLYVFVDNDKYMEDSYYNRLRFSIAHEIGHLILHKKLYQDLKIKNIDDFIKFLTDIPNKQYGFLETQANKFANYFLIPRNILGIERNKILKKYKEIQSFDTKQINSYIATPLSKMFGVNSEPMEIALNSDDDKKLETTSWSG